MAKLRHHDHSSRWDETIGNQRSAETGRRVAFRKKVYRSIDELQTDLDAWVRDYNEARPHQGRWCFGKMPMQTFFDAMPIAKMTAA